MLRLLAVGLSAVALSACSSLGLGGSDNGLAFLKEVNAHLDGCDRTYQGTTTPVPQITVHIECHAQAPAAPAPAAPAAP